MFTHEIEGTFSVKCLDAYLWIKYEFDYSGYLKVLEVRIYPDENDYFIEGSEIFKRWIEKDKFEFLYNQAIDRHLPF